MRKLFGNDKHKKDIEQILTFLVVSILEPFSPLKYRHTHTHSKTTRKYRSEHKLDQTSLTYIISSDLPLLCTLIIFRRGLMCHTHIHTAKQHVSTGVRSIKLDQTSLTYIISSDLPLLCTLIFRRSLCVFEQIWQHSKEYFSTCNKTYLLLKSA